MKKLTKSLVAFVLVVLVATVFSNSAQAAESPFPKGYEKIPESRRTELFDQACKEIDGTEGTSEYTITKIEELIVEDYNKGIELGYDYLFESDKRYIELLKEELENGFSLSQKRSTWKVISSGTKIYASQLVKPILNSGKVTYTFDDGSEYKVVSTTGTKEFTVIAEDADGNKAEKKVTVKCKKGKRPLITLYSFVVNYNSKNKSFYTYTRANSVQNDMYTFDRGILARAKNGYTNCDNWFIAVDCDDNVFRPTNNKKDVIPKKFKTGETRTITFTATDKYNNVSKVKVKVKAISPKKWDNSRDDLNGYSKYNPPEGCDYASRSTPDKWHTKILVQVRGTKVVKEVLNSYTKKRTTINGINAVWYFSNQKGFNAFVDYCCAGMGYYDKLRKAGIPTYGRIGCYGLDSKNPAAQGVSLNMMW